MPKEEFKIFFVVVMKCIAVTVGETFLKYEEIGGLGSRSSSVRTQQMEKERLAVFIC
jgi:hypothetical protein